LGGSCIWEVHESFSMYAAAAFRQARTASCRVRARSAARAGRAAARTCPRPRSAARTRRAPRASWSAWARRCTGRARARRWTGASWRVRPRRRARQRGPALTRWGPRTPAAGGRRLARELPKGAPRPVRLRRAVRSRGARRGPRRTRPRVSPGPARPTLHYPTYGLRAAGRLRGAEARDGGHAAARAAAPGGVRGHRARHARALRQQPPARHPVRGPARLREDDQRPARAAALSPAP
jgi:hypothetical protein